uniref:Uncharacterized protein n=1 Tax=Cyprinus carpio TaxID=7962 RepID=A0A8C2FEZ0_CYPCA
MTLRYSNEQPNPNFMCDKNVFALFLFHSHKHALMWASALVSSPEVCCFLSSISFPTAKKKASETTSLSVCLFRFVDVGNQRGLRRKWIHCFENVTSLLFLASLSEYDRSLEENNKENRMEESLSLFYNTIHSQWFANSFIILFLNKMDILAEKIQFSDLKTYYPEFEGKRRDVGDALQFIAQLYEKKAVSNKTKNYRMIYSHFICATDTKNIWRVFNDVKYTILIRDLGTYRML